MQNKEKEILVYADWYMFASPKLVGCIYFASLRGKGVYSFEYDKEWIKSGIAIDPELPLFAGKHYASANENFGIFNNESTPKSLSRQF